MRSVHMLTLLCIALSGSFVSFAQTADEIIARHLEAIGGAAKWRQIDALKLHGTINAEGNSIRVSTVQLHGKGMRQDIFLGALTGYQIITKTHGWTYLPFQGQTTINTMSDEAVKLAQNELDAHGPLLDYKEKGHSVSLDGKESIDGRECHRILLTFNSGKTATICIDPDTYYVVRVTTKEMINGQSQELVTNFDNFEKISEGIVIPKSCSLPYGTMTIDRIEVNPVVDENIFTPEKKAVNAKE